LRRFFPGTGAYRNVELHPEALTFPGLLIWRPGGDLFFASIGHLGDGLKAALAASQPPTKHVLVDAEAVNHIDVSACDALLNIIQELQSHGVTFAVARACDHVRERLRLGGVETVVGSTNICERVTNGLRAWQQHEAPDGVSSGTS
jgi:MFS superfamily sulfate permease-like transporter